jgi:sugar lactone lactonase YvrE
MDWSLALSPDGKSLYAVNTATGVIAVASTGADGAPAIVRTAHLEAATGGGAVRGAISATVAGAFVVAGGPSGVTWIDATTLRIHAHTVPGWSIAGVGLSSDRQTVYAVSAEGRIAVIATPSARVVGMFDPGVGEPMALMRVEAA